MHQAVSTEQHPWLALNMAYAAWPALRTQITRLLTAPDILQRLPREGMSALTAQLPALIEKLALIQQGQAFTREVDRIQAVGATVVTLAEAAYPYSLRWIPDPPPVLYVRGTLQPEDSCAIAVVGSRTPSSYGKLMAKRLSTELARHSFTVVSGMARGIDSLAHQSAIEADGRTIAVLGSGINVVYPSEHRQLYEAISAHGAVLSEFLCDTKPDRWNFPRRNRIISGLALGTLVVEASDRSGSLHTARHAIEQGREVFAVPGRIDVPSSRGTNNLIKQGAKLIEGIDDIVAELPDDVQPAVQQHAPLAPPCLAFPPADLAPQEAQLLALVPPDETHIEALIHTSQLPAHVVASILVTLELRGLVRQFPGKFFARS